MIRKFSGTATVYTFDPNSMEEWDQVLRMGVPNEKDPRIRIEPGKITILNVQEDKL